MKDMAKSLILKPKAYGSALQPDHEFDHLGGHNSQDYEDKVFRNVQELLKDATFLQDLKKDNEVHWDLLRHTQTTRVLAGLQEGIQEREREVYIDYSPHTLLEWRS